MEEQVMFTDQDIFHDLDRVDPEVMSQWPQASSFGLHRREHLLEDQPGKQDIHFTEATTQTASLAMTNVELARCITPPDGMEEE